MNLQTSINLQKWTSRRYKSHRRALYYCATITVTLYLLIIQSPLKHWSHLKKQLTQHQAQQRVLFSITEGPSFQHDQALGESAKKQLLLPLNDDGLISRLQSLIGPLRLTLIEPLEAVENHSLIERRIKLTLEGSRHALSQFAKRLHDLPGLLGIEQLDIEQVDKNHYRFNCQLMGFSLINQALKDQQTNMLEPAETIISEPYQLHHLLVNEASSLNIAKWLKQLEPSVLSSEGHIAADERTNGLWIYETDKRFNAIARIIRQLDQPSQQVAIEARLVSLRRDRAKELGARLKVNPSNKTIQSELEVQLPGNQLSTLSIPKFGFSVVNIANHRLLDLELSALENEGLGEVLSRPHLMTTNHETAEIEMGEQIPYQQTSANGATTVEFKKAVLRLQVKPTIMSDGRVRLRLAVNQDSRSPHPPVLGVPAIETRQISTEVILKNGQTLVLGGIFEVNRHESHEKIPLLGDVPLFGQLFKHRSQDRQQNELLIFVTPTLYSGGKNPSSRAKT